MIISESEMDLIVRFLDLGRIMKIFYYREILFLKYFLEIFDPSPVPLSKITSFATYSI
jgi:hypothetical protein